MDSSGLLQGYGYENKLEDVRSREFRRLSGVTYMDWAGTALYSETQLRGACEELCSMLLTNPHSGSGPGTLEQDQRLRHLTLTMCHTSSDQYEVVLTGGATAALKLVSESLPWCSTSQLVYLRQNHNSVLGIREEALAAGASVQAVDLEFEQSLPVGLGHNGNVQLVRCGPQMQSATTGDAEAGKSVQQEQDEGAPLCLFAMAHECNFSGQRLDLSLINHVQHAGPWAVWQPQGPHQPAPLANQTSAQTETHVPIEQANAGQSAANWLVVLDAAKGAATQPPNLRQHSADFVALSYYKIFGYPTGLGALLVRKGRAAQLLHTHKRYFGGGTVAVSIAEEHFMRRRAGPAGLEDGTPAFSSIVAALHGFKFIKQLGGPKGIAAHTRVLGEHLHRQLCSLRHATGIPLVVVYGRPAEQSSGSPTLVLPGVSGWGPTVTFNLLRPDGSWVGYHEVLRLAALQEIHLRSGCFCNPGACAKFLGLTPQDLRSNYEAGHVCWDDQDLLRGRPTGAVRASLGHISSLQDVEALMSFLRHYFLDRSASDLELKGVVEATVSKSTISNVVHLSAAADVCSSRNDAAQLEFSSRPQFDSKASQQSDFKQQPASDSGLLPQSSSNSGQQSEFNSGQQSQPGIIPDPDPGVQQDPDSSHQFDSSQQQRPAEVSTSLNVSEQPPCLVAMYLYPIKSCAPQQVQHWPLGPNGLLYDREWALVDDTGKVVTQKGCPRAALVQPWVDLDAGVLTITAPGVSEPLRIPMQLRPATAPDAGNQPAQHPALPAHTSAVRSALLQQNSSSSGLQEVIRVCGDRVCGSVVSTVMGSWPAADSATGAEMSFSQTAGNLAPKQDACARKNATQQMRSWFEAAIGIPCHLVQQQPGARVARQGTAGLGPQVGSKAQSTGTPGEQLSERLHQVVSGPNPLQPGQPAPAAPGLGFANDGQILLISTTSVADVNARVLAARATAGPVLRPQEPETSQGQPVELLRFRPNLVIDGLPAYEEDTWSSVQVGPLPCQVLGTCPRCEMLQVDQTTGTRGRPDVLLALAQYRRHGGRMHFGILLSALPQQPDHVMLSVGQRVMGQRVQL